MKILNYSGTPYEYHFRMLRSASRTEPYIVICSKSTILRHHDPKKDLQKDNSNPAMKPDSPEPDFTKHNDTHNTPVGANRLVELQQIEELGTLLQLHKRKQKPILIFMAPILYSLQHLIVLLFKTGIGSLMQT